MIPFRVLLILACALLALGCSDPLREAEKRLRQGGTEQLRHDAALLHKSIYSAHVKPVFVEVWYKEWPKSFQQYNPLHVGAYLDGVSLALAASDHGERGLFIVPQSMDIEPVNTSRASYRKISEGIYWYTFNQ